MAQILCHRFLLITSEPQSEIIAYEALDAIGYRDGNYWLYPLEAI
ncbi:MAG: hypothetical protein AAFR67_17095 [Chloroflexota bacterium]